MGLALLIPAPLLAQATGTGPGLSSGSGAGTGTGTSSSIQRNPSGSLSGSGPGPASGGRTGGSAPRGGDDLAPDRAPRRPGEPSIPLGPGANTRFPDDPSLVPFDDDTRRGGGRRSGGSTIPPELIAAARSITNPAERSLSLQRIGATAILGDRLDLARETLDEAGKASLEVPVPLVRDQRLMGTITMMLNLTEALMRRGKDNLLPLDETELEARMPPVDRARLIRGLLEFWSRAVDLCLTDLESHLPQRNAQPGRGERGGRQPDHRDLILEERGRGNRGIRTGTLLRFRCRPRPPRRSPPCRSDRSPHLARSGDAPGRRQRRGVQPVRSGSRDRPGDPPGRDSRRCPDADRRGAIAEQPGAGGLVHLPGGRPRRRLDPAGRSSRYPDGRVDRQLDLGGPLRRRTGLDRPVLERRRTGSPPWGPWPSRRRGAAWQTRRVRGSTGTSPPRIARCSIAASTTVSCRSSS